MLAVLIPAPGSAQDDEGFSLTVSPARVVVPSSEEQSTQRVRASNSGTIPLHVDVSTAEFRQLPNGQIVFDSGTDPFAATQWLEVTPLAFDLDPGDERFVRVDIDIPEDAEPGERQVAVLFTVEAGETEGNIRLNRTIASELLINVPGEIIEKVAFGPLRAPGFTDGGPIPISLEVRNLGNVHRDYIEPDNLVVTTSSGATVELPPFTVLRQSQRVIDAQWIDPPLMCICTLSVTSDDGQGNEITATTRVVVFPLRLIAGVLITAVGMFLLTRGGLRRQRRKVEHRIERARREAYEEALREAEEAAGRTGAPD